MLDDTLKADILVVDDTYANLRMLTRILSEHGYTVRSMSSGEQAITSAQTIPPDLILLDIAMPDLNGYEVCQILKTDERTADIPIIFISALHNINNIVQAFTAGGVDYITKPFRMEEVLARLKTHLTLRNLQRELSQTNSLLEKRVDERTAELAEANRTLSEEITERKRIEARLRYLALHDMLTGLPNRTYFQGKLQEMLDLSQQNPEFHFGILFIDCDRFKLVNDAFGHLVGDKLLVEIARRLEECLGVNDVLSRFGGDEFTILLPDVQSLDDVTIVAETIQKAFIPSVHLEQRIFFIDLSIGIVLNDGNSYQPEQLLRNADIAMYAAKREGNGRYQIFSPEMYDQVLATQFLETEVRQAWQHRQFIVFYQPVVELATGQLSGFEALVRWLHPSKGIVMPSKFIDIAEEIDLILSLGEWVLHEASSQTQQWREQFGLPLSVNVNWSAKQFTQPSLIDRIDQILQTTGLPKACLKLELTESVVMRDADTTLSILQSLKAQDIQICLDDFGVGYSSLSYLHQLPIDILKIDRSFVQSSSRNLGNLEIVRTIHSLARNLEMQVVVEGVETTDQLAALRHIGCEYGQGYLFAHPLTPTQVTELLAAELPWQFTFKQDSDEEYD